jgi:hypothetical protein
LNFKAKSLGLILTSSIHAHSLGASAPMQEAIESLCQPILSLLLFHIALKQNCAQKDHIMLLAVLNMSGGKATDFMTLWGQHHHTIFQWHHLRD